jgi:DivIVA domain-containing protein
MDRDSIERIRTATFKVGRRGYDKREVDRFLEKLADWLETGGGDDARSEVVRAELERIGEQTGRILTSAHEASEALRAETEAALENEREEAKRYSSGLRAEADAYSERTHIEADEYATETRGEADAYAARMKNEANADAATSREDAEAYAETARSEADERAAETIRAAESQAGQIVDDATRRRREIEKVVADLADRRQTVIEDMQRLSSELVGTASEHEGLESALEEEPGEDTREFTAVDGDAAEELEDAELSDAEQR